MGLEASVSASSPATGDGLGFAVAVRGNLLVAGAPSTPVGAPTGSAVVYQRAAGGGWSFAQELPAPAAEPQGGFGVSVDLSSTHLVVGSNGRAHVYDLAPGAGVPLRLDQELTPSGVGTFGRRVAVSDRAVIVGDAAYPSPGPFQVEGTAHVYEALPPAGAWSKVLRIQPPSIGLTLGEFVAAEGDLVAATDEGAIQVTGYLRVYRRASSGRWRPLADRFSLGGPYLFNPSALAIAGDQIVVRAQNDVAQTFDLLVFQVADREREFPGAAGPTKR